MDTLFEQIALANIEQARREKGGILPTHARLDGGGGGSSRPQAREEEDLPLPPAQQSEADDEDDGLVTFSSRLVRTASVAPARRQLSPLQVPQPEVGRQQRQPAAGRRV